MRLSSCDGKKERMVGLRENQILCSEFISHKCFVRVAPTEQYDPLMSYQNSEALFGESSTDHFSLTYKAGNSF